MMMEQLRFIKSCKGEVYPTNNREQNIFKKKKVLFRSLIAGLSIIIGFLYGFQHLLWLNDIHWDYKNAIFITSFEAWDADHYIAQMPILPNTKTPSDLPGQSSRITYLYLSENSFILMYNIWQYAWTFFFHQSFFS
jgi:hypothetical protein